MSDQKRYYNLIDFSEQPSLLTVDEKLTYLNDWFLAMIAYDLELPITFTRCCNRNLHDEEKTKKSLNDLTTFLSCFVSTFPYTLEYPFRKLFLEIQLEKVKNLGDYPDIEKLPGSQYYFGMSEEELYAPVSEVLGILFLSDFQIENVPEDTIIFIDKAPKVRPYYIAQQIISKDLREIFETLYEEAIKEKNMPQSKNAEEKELLYKAWLKRTLVERDNLHRILGENKLI